MTHKIITEECRIECRANKTLSGAYYGQIRVFREKAPVGFLWAHSSYVDRLNKEDALKDAEALKAEALAGTLAR